MDRTQADQAIFEEFLAALSEPFGTPKKTRRVNGTVNGAVNGVVNGAVATKRKRAENHDSWGNLCKEAETVTVRYRSLHYLNLALQAHRTLQNLSKETFGGTPICLELIRAGRTADKIYFAQFSTLLPGATCASAKEIMTRDESCKARERQLIGEVWPRLHGMAAGTPPLAYYTGYQTRCTFPIIRMLRCSASRKIK